MSTQSPYLSSGNLHWKPVTAHFARGSLWLTTVLQRNASPMAWYGRAVVFLSKANLVLTAFVLLPVAFIETTALFIIGGLGVVCNKLVYRNESEFIQKHSLKAIAYGLHSSIMVIALFALGVMAFPLREHTPRALIDHGIHLVIAALVQTTVGAVLDRAVGREDRSSVVRLLNLFWDSHPALINDVITQVQRDLNLNLRSKMGRTPHVENYLNRHPQARAFVNEFRIQSLRNRDYRLRTLAFIREFLVETQLVQPGEDPNLLEFNTTETVYQEALVRHLKNAFIDIYKNPALAKCLDSIDKDGNVDQQGQTLLKDQDASIYGPLTSYAQYKELLEPVACPDQFIGNLARYNNRRADLIAAKRQIDDLSRNDRTRLIQKILRGGHYTPQEEKAISGPVKKAFLSIGKLAHPLHQGPLMLKMGLNLGGGDIIARKNLFQKAMREAIDEVSS